MPDRRKLEYDRPESTPGEEWVRMPVVIDANGDRMISLFDDQGQPHARAVAEVVLEAFVGPCPPGQILRFKDGDRLNCDLANLEWVPAEGPAIEDHARAYAIETRRRFDEIRKSLEGRYHSDSAELLAEDRLR